MEKSYFYVFYVFVRMIFFTVVQFEQKESTVPSLLCFILSTRQTELSTRNKSVQFSFFFTRNVDQIWTDTFFMHH